MRIAPGIETTRTPPDKGAGRSGTEAKREETASTPPDEGAGKKKKRRKKKGPPGTEAKREGGDVPPLSYLLLRPRSFGDLHRRNREEPRSGQQHQ